MDRTVQRRQGWRSLAAEVVVVVFSVVLALALDEWRDERASVERMERAERGIRAELQANRTELAGALALNDSMLVRLQQAVKSRVGRFDGFQFSFAQLSMAAWQTAQGTNVLQRMDFERLLTYARLYELQALFGNEQTRFVSDLSRSAVDEDPTAARRIVREAFVRLAGVSSVGHSLLKEYDTALGTAQR